MGLLGAGACSSDFWSRSCAGIFEGQCGGCSTPDVFGELVVRPRSLGGAALSEGAGIENRSASLWGVVKAALAEVM